MDNLLLSPDLLRVAKLNASEAHSLLYDAATDDGGEPTLKPDAPSILAKRILDRMEQERKDKLGQGIKQRSQQIEAIVRPLFEQYGVESDDIVNGITDLTEKIKLAKREKPDLSDLNDDEVVKLPAFQKKLNAELAAARAEREALQKQHADYMAAVEQQKKDSYVFGFVEQALTKAQAAFGANRSAQLRHFFNGLEKEYFHVSEDGTIDLLDKDGIAIRGANKEMLTFDEYVVGKWRDLGYATNDAPPASPAPGKSGSPGNFTTSAAVQEAIKITKDPITKADLLKKLAELTRAGK
jgi:hypothetical protein